MTMFPVHPDQHDSNDTRPGNGRGKRREHDAGTEGLLGARIPRTVQIGCGYWGKNLARALGKLGALAAVVDENVALSDSMAAEHGVFSISLDEALTDRTVRAVSIATPASTHFEVAMQALEAGKDVFVEKPMALIPEQAEQMIDAAEGSGRILMVGHLLNYHPAFERLVDVVRQGRLGRLRYIYSNRLNFGKIRREEDILWSFAPHDISMILRLAGETPSAVKSHGTFALHPTIADATTTHLRFPSGIDSHIFVSWLHPFKEQRLVVVGDKGMASFDDRADWPEKLAIYRGEVEWVDGIPMASPLPPEFVDVEESEPLLLEMEHFMESVANRTRPTSDGHEGLEVLRVLDAATADLRRSSNTTTDTIAASAAQAPTTQVHETAIIDAGSRIGDETRIWHFSHVLPGSSIGRNCSLGQNVVVGPNVSIGDDCKIQNNVSVFEGVTLEDGVFCGPSMVFTNVITPRATVNRKAEFSPTLVRRGASIGANATIVCGSTVGEYALVGAGAVVTSDVPAHALVVGVPARQVAWVSRAGEVLDGSLTCPRTDERYETVDEELRLMEEK